MPEHFTLIHVLDLLILAGLLSLIYRLLKGSTALTIAIGLLVAYGVFSLLEYYEMPYTGKFLSAFRSVGIIFLAIVFQQETRRFFLVIGKNILNGNRFSLQRILPAALSYKKNELHMMEAILEACQNLSAQQNGAIIVFTGTAELKFISQSGTNVDALVSTKIIESIFNKQSPLHDGALIINNNRIKAAGCVLPLATEITNLPENVGLRHRAAVSITYQTDSVALIVSEENGNISIARQGLLFYNLNKEQLLKELVDGS